LQDGKIEAEDEKEDEEDSLSLREDPSATTILTGGGASKGAHAEEVPPDSMGEIPHGARLWPSLSW